MLQIPCCEGRDSAATKALYHVLKDHKNPMIQDLINSSYEHCCRDEMEILVGDGDLMDSEDCGTESAVRVCLVNRSFTAALQLAVKKMQDAKLVIDHFGFSIEYSAPENEETRLSDKLTVLINDIGIAMKSMEYALFCGKFTSAQWSNSPTLTSVKSKLLSIAWQQTSHFNQDSSET